MVSTAALLKPLSASSAVKMPVTISKTTTPRATTSTRNHSVMKRRMAPSKMMDTIHMSMVTAGVSFLHAFTFSYCRRPLASANARDGNRMLSHPASGAPWR